MSLGTRREHGAPNRSHTQSEGWPLTARPRGVGGLCPADWPPLAGPCPSLSCDTSLHPPGSVSSDTPGTPSSHLQPSPSLVSLKIFKSQPTFFFLFVTGQVDQIDSCCAGQNTYQWLARLLPPGPPPPPGCHPAFPPSLSSAQHLMPALQGHPSCVLSQLSVPPISSKWDKLRRSESSLSWGLGGQGARRV